MGKRKQYWDRSGEAGKAIFGLIGLLVPLASGLAQEVATTASRPGWLVTPSISVSATLTDNVHPGQGQKQSDLVASVAPAIRVDGKGGRVGGSLNFSWQQNWYANESRYDNDQKFLAANGKAELIEQWLFLDAAASIAQHAASVFGTQSIGNELATGNRSETRSFQLSPYVQGYLGGSVGYELRYRNTHTSADSGLYATGSGVDGEAWSGRLSGATPLVLLGWSLTAEDQRSSFGTQPDLRTNRWLGTLEYRIDPQFKVNLSTGHEEDNYSSLQARSRTVSGYGFDWAPTERSKLAFKQERRSFGHGHEFSFEHRTGLTAWKFLDSKSVVIPAQQFTSVPISTAYDLLYLQLGSDPMLRNDPVARALTTSALLRLAGIPENSLVFGNIMTAQPFIQRRQLASVSLTGANNTVVLSAQRSSSERLATGVSALDAFALTQNVRQSGVSASWSHRLTPDSTLTLNALASHSRGDAATQDARLRSVSLLYSTKLGAKTTASLGVRQNRQDNASAIGADYTEHAITGMLSASF